MKRSTKRLLTYAAIGVGAYFVYNQFVAPMLASASSGSGSGTALPPSSGSSGTMQGLGYGPWGGRRPGWWWRHGYGQGGGQGYGGGYGGDPWGQDHAGLPQSNVGGDALIQDFQDQYALES